MRPLLGHDRNSVAIETLWNRDAHMFNFDRGNGRSWTVGAAHEHSNVGRIRFDRVKEDGSYVGCVVPLTGSARVL